MSSVIAFVPRSDLTAQHNVAAFVKLCREQLTALGANLEFDKDIWDLTAYLQSKADRTSKRLYFSRFGSERGSMEDPLGRAFSDFAKSYIRYTYAVRPTIALGRRLLALQALESALTKTQGETDPTRITAQTLNVAAQLVVDRFGPDASYQTGREMKNLVDFMRRKRMLAVPITWKNPISKPPHTTRIGPDFEARRDKRLPDVEALRAITSIFRLSNVMSDVLVSSTCAVLCSAPDRISEVLLLPEVCDVTKKDSTTGKTLHGLRWFPAKGGPPQVKWPASVMSDTMREAVGNIRHYTNQAREVARWYELNPKKLYLPADLEHLRGAPELTMSQVHQIVFETEDPDGILGGNWCREKKLKLTKFGGRVYIPFQLVESALLAMLPADFPIADKDTGLKYSEMLFLVQRNALHAQRGTYRSVVEPVVYQNIVKRLSGDTVSNIFARFGYFKADGTPLSVGTHQFRHYLNTLAQAGGMSQEDIAYWSGRKSEIQNDNYDGVSGNDLLELAEAATSSSAPKSTAVATRTFALIPRSAWKELGIEAGHTTEFGYCLHDFSMLPCQLHLDCLNCDEQVCVKGDLIREENIRRQRAETESLLKTAESAYGEGEAGSNRWVDHQKKTLTHLNELCNLLDDPKIEVGAAIRLSRIIPPTKLQQSADKIRIAGSPKTR